MANTNRADDYSNQRIPLQVGYDGPLIDSDTGVMAMIPLPAKLEVANFAAINPNSAVTIQFFVTRFIAGSGFTSWSLCSAYNPPDFQSSGIIHAGVSLPGSGSTLCALMPNDILAYQIGGGASATIGGFIGSFVIRPIQDVKTFLGGLV